jgi:hypothetical protein
MWRFTHQVMCIQRDIWNGHPKRMNRSAPSRGLGEISYCTRFSVFFARERQLDSFLSLFSPRRDLKGFALEVEESRRYGSL